MAAMYKSTSEMDTFPLCRFEDLSKSRKSGALTVSLVLFAHKDGGNLNRYVRGLHLWISGYIHQFPPGTVITLFIDENMRKDIRVRKALSHKRVRGISFRCRDYMRDGHFDSLFPTLVRFFPAMTADGSRLSKCLVHVFDIEPARQDVSDHLLYLRLVKRHNDNDHGRHIDFFYNPANDLKTLPFTYNDKDCPYVLAGRVTLFRRFESELMLRFLQDMQKSSSMEWFYGIMQTPFCRGVDEIFTNKYLLPYFIRKGFTIAYSENYCITGPMYWWNSVIRKDQKSVGYLQGVLADGDDDIVSLMNKFDKQFYGCERVNSVSKTVAERYYSLLRSLVRAKEPWFPLDFMKYVLRHFDNFIATRRLVVVCPKKTTYIDIETVKFED